LIFGLIIEAEVDDGFLDIDDFWCLIMAVSVFVVLFTTLYDSIYGIHIEFFVAFEIDSDEVVEMLQSTS
jgi:hypothetical protein